jgi:hypothetical protein
VSAIRVVLLVMAVVVAWTAGVLGALALVRAAVRNLLPARPVPAPTGPAIGRAAVPPHPHATAAPARADAWADMEPQGMHDNDFALWAAECGTTYTPPDRWIGDAATRWRNTDWQTGETP